MGQLIADILNATAATGRTGCAGSEDLEVQEDLLRQQHMKSQTGIFNRDQILAYCWIGHRHLTIASSSIFNKKFRTVVA